MNTADADRLVRRFWTELQDIRTGMLGLAGGPEAHARPMTAHFEGASGPIYFYTGADAALAAKTAAGHAAAFHYAGSGHELFACVHGPLSVSTDSATFDRFWTDQVARWFPDGRGSVVLLKFEPEEAQIWLPASDPPVDVRAKATL
jgi:general stress protein 26